MKCEEYFVLLCGHMDGMNDQNEEERLQTHLTSCESCSELLAQMQENDAALRETQEIPADLTQKIMQKVRKEPEKQKKRYWNVFASGVAVAAVLAVVLLGGIGLPMPEETMRAEAAPACEAQIITEAPGYAESLTEQDQVVPRSAPKESVAEYSFTSEIPTGATESMFVVEDRTFYAATAKGETKQTVTALFLFASEAEELDEGKLLDFSGISLPQEARKRLETLSGKDLSAYSVSYELFQHLKEAYPSEYFAGSTDDCVVCLISTP